MLFSSLAETKKVILKFTASENSLMGYIDRDKLEKILTNLLSNAFKFTPEGGMVEVSLTSLPLASPLTKGGTRWVEITVTNTGPGIPAGQIEKIFDRFYQAPLGQADDNYKKDSEGSGIGLALTKELVEVCHGEISVSSTPNKTTSFVFTLPIAKGHFKENEIIKELETEGRRQETVKQITIDNEKTVILSDSKDRSPVSRLQSPLILIVEDNTDVTNYISSFMENDYRIITAENGKLGFKNTLDKYPDLVINEWF
ncbi:ATP-binding protein [Calditrichota bacterium]